jgi:hypothetical protein
MDAVREQLNKPLVAGIAAFFLGLIIGLVVLGWWLFPVQWTDAAPSQLRADLKEDYLRMAIDSYTLNRNAELAFARYEALGEDAPEILDVIQANPGTQVPEALLAFRTVVQAGAPPVAEATPAATTPLGTAVVGAVTPGTPAVETPAAAATPAPAGSSLMRVVLPVLCVITLLLAGGLIALFVLRSRSPRGRSFSPATAARPSPQQDQWTEYSAGGEDAPTVQFMASYKLGDDLFDDSFSIDSPSGEFLGECGVGISEPIGVGDPKKVTAFEVWLFDKNDIQTVTKVLMSAHAYGDEQTRQRLVAKGEPVLVEPGTETRLETQSLQLVLRVVDMGYGEGPLPPESFFDRLVLELAVWHKNQQS